jgi:hypothetical protein
VDEDTKTNLKRLGIIVGVLMVILVGVMAFRGREDNGPIKVDKGWYETGIMTKDGVHFAGPDGKLVPPPPGYHMAPTIAAARRRAGANLPIDSDAAP